MSYFKLLFVLPVMVLLLAANNAVADITVTWEPGAVVEGTPVDEWLLFCANASALYPAPIIIPAALLTYTLLVPDGATKCKMRSRSNNNIWNIPQLDSADSIEVTFLVVSGMRVDPRPNAPSLVVN